MSSYHSSSKYGNSVVVVQGGSSSSTYSAGSSTSRSSTYSTSPSYSQSAFSMNSSSSSSQPLTQERYRSGSSAGFYTNVKEVPSSRGGANVVVVHHNRPNPNTDEPRASEYQRSGGYYSKK